MNLLSVEEVAEMLQVTENTVRRYINQRELKAYKLGKAWQIDKDDLKLFLESRSNFNDHQ